MLAVKSYTRGSPSGGAAASEHLLFFQPRCG